MALEGQGWAEALQRPWQQLRDKLGLDDVPDELLCQAMAHPSWIAEKGLDPLQSNQRLEFLGDAILGAIVAEYLFQSLPNLPEGVLTHLKSQVVRGEALAEVARELGLGQWLLLGPEERESGGADKPSILADAMEALVGAVYLALGFERTRKFVRRILQRLLERAASGQAELDPKSALQQFLLRTTHELPSYATVSVEGPDHARVFEVVVRWRGKVIGRGRGTSKQRAQQEAARDALDNKDKWAAELAGADSSGDGCPGQPN